MAFTRMMVLDKSRIDMVGLLKRALLNYSELSLGY